MTATTELVWRYAKPHWRTWLLLTALTAGMAATSLAQPWIVKLLIDHVFTGSNDPSMRAMLVVGAAVAGLVLFALASAFEIVHTRLAVRTGYGMVYDLSGALFGTLLRKPLHFHRQRSVGDAMARVTGDSWCVYRLVDAACLVPAKAILITAWTAAVMFPMDPWLTATTLVAAPVMAALNVSLGRRRRRNARHAREIESQLQAHVHQTLSGIDLVQGFGREAHEHQRFQEYAGLVVRAQRRGAMLTSLSDLASGTVTTLGTGIVLLLSARQVLGGTLPLGSMIVFVAYLGVLYEQIKSALTAYLSVQALGGQIDRVVETLRYSTELPETTTPVTLTRSRGHLSFDRVTVGFQPGTPVVRGVTLDIQPGERIALVGRTGAGKSTLAALVPRFLDPWSGSVRLDGRDIREFRLRDLRAQIAIVHQEPMLFPVSIAENIRFGRPDASDDDVRAAAVAARADGFIRELPEGYDTEVGERGATLSGGERQRIAIARALLRDAPIVILDEPTSAVDTTTESAVMDALFALTEGRTTILIAHRLSSVTNVDRIVVLDEGRVVESGSHADLLGRGGQYAEMAGVNREPERVAG